MTQELRDRRTVGVTPVGQQNLDQLMALNWFADEVDVFRLAISVTLRRNIDSGDYQMTGRSTKWNIGTLDPEGLVRDVIVAFAPSHSDRPMIFAELCGAVGLDWLKLRLVDEHALLSDVLTED